MTTPLSFVPEFRHVLVVAAAPKEVSAVLAAFGHEGMPEEWRRVDVQEGWSIVRCGVGKVNAALCVARCLAAGGEPGTLVLNVGVCGVLPTSAGAAIRVGDIVLASASVYADEGVDAGADGFTDMSELGFGYWEGAPGQQNDPSSSKRCSAIVPTAALVEATSRAARESGIAPVTVGPIATVSTCSGTDALAGTIAIRTGAVAEAMEGAAIGHALLRTRGTTHGYLELRAVSNRTGDRSRQGWDLPGALDALTRLLRMFRDAAQTSV